MAYHSIRVVCKLCGTESTAISPTSFSYLGSPDLDTRPPETSRSALRYWLQRCPQCGYCAPDLAQGLMLAASVITQRQYQAQLANRVLPDLANTLLCWSLIQERTGNYRAAAWACLRAAWVCDDALLADAAQRTRLNAILLFNQAPKLPGNYPSEAGMHELVLADLNRRTGRLLQVADICWQGLSKDAPAEVCRALTFEIHLAACHDTACHTLDEAYQRRYHSIAYPAGFAAAEQSAPTAAYGEIEALAS